MSRLPDSIKAPLCSADLVSIGTNRGFEWCRYRYLAPWNSPAGRNVPYVVILLAGCLVCWSWPVWLAGPIAMPKRTAPAGDQSGSVPSLRMAR